MNRTSLTSPTSHTSRTVAPADVPASSVLGGSPRRALGAVAGALAALALGARDAAGHVGGAEAERGQVTADLSLSYSDSHGPGQLTVTPLEGDDSTGGTAVSIHLAQARGPFAGPGFVRRVDGDAYLVAGTVVGVEGIPGGSRDSYFLSGTLLRQDGGWRGQGRWVSVAGPSLSGVWNAAEWPAIEPPRMQLTAGVRLDAIGSSGVKGATTLVALADGETGFELQLEGLAPGAGYVVRLHAGSVARPSASFTQLAAVTADAGGRASAHGLVRFRGTEAIPLLEIGGGEHLITVSGAVGTVEPVAAGAIPAVQPLG